MNLRKIPKLSSLKTEKSGSQDPDTCGKVIQESLKNGLLLAGAGSHKNIIRLLVPLVITEEQLNEGLDVLDRAIETVTKA